MLSSVRNQVFLLFAGRGDSSVLFACLFLLLFDQTDNIYKVEQESLYFFLKGIQRELFKGKETYRFQCAFRAMIFLKGSTPIFHGGSPKNSL